MSRDPGIVFLTCVTTHFLIFVVLTGVPWTSAQSLLIPLLIAEDDRAIAVCVLASNLTKIELFRMAFVS